MIGALAQACTETSDAAAGRATVLISIAFERLTKDELSAARIEARIIRATRTLVFSEADAFGADGARVMSASAVREAPAA